MKTDRWRPHHGARVRVPNEDDETLPPGAWYVVERGPGKRRWWLHPIDLESKSWALMHPYDTTNGCWLASEQQLAPLDQKGDR